MVQIKKYLPGIQNHLSPAIADQKRNSPSQGSSIPSRITGAILLVALMTTITGHVQAQELDAPYVSTPHAVVDKMLDLAGVGPGDYVIDLGSGDGRIVIAAARRGAVGHGVELNPELVDKAQRNAAENGVSGRVMFLEEDIFETDFSQASVITMYLLSTVNIELRPRLLNMLEPGTRIVSHSFSMGAWEADEILRLEGRNLYYWVIPADAEGEWQWETDGMSFHMSASQEFQNVSATMHYDGQELFVDQVDLKGSRLTILTENLRNGDRFVFSGRVHADRITGTVQIHNENHRQIRPWTAVRGL